MSNFIKIFENRFPNDNRIKTPITPYLANASP